MLLLCCDWQGCSSLNAAFENHLSSYLPSEFHTSQSCAYQFYKLHKKCPCLQETCLRADRRGDMTPHLSHNMTHGHGKRVIRLDLWLCLSLLKRLVCVHIGGVMAALRPGGFSVLVCCRILFMLLPYLTSALQFSGKINMFYGAFCASGI